MWLNLQETVDLVTFTEEILEENLYFLCNVSSKKYWRIAKQKLVTFLKGVIQLKFYFYKVQMKKEKLNFLKT